MVLRSVAQSSGRIYMLTMERAEYYRASSSPKSILIALVCALVLLCILLAVLMAFYNYRPIRNLVWDLTGEDPELAQSDELGSIRDAFSRSQARNEQLLTRVTSQLSIARDQFLLRLIQGKVRSGEELRYYSACLELPLEAGALLCMVGMVPQIDERRQVVDRILDQGKRQTLENVRFFVAESGFENYILCICCFDAPGQDTENPRRAAAGAARRAARVTSPSRRWSNLCSSRASGVGTRAWPSRRLTRSSGR